MVKQQERQPSHAPFPVLKLRKQETVLNVADRQSSVALWHHISFGLAVSNGQGGACAVFRRPLECDNILWKVMSDVSKYHSACTFRVVLAGEGSTVATSHNTWPLFRHSYSCHVCLTDNSNSIHPEEERPILPVCINCECQLPLHFSFWQFVAKEDRRAGFCLVTRISWLQ